MNKILELSKKIHAAGFEPDLYHKQYLFSNRFFLEPDSDKGFYSNRIHIERPYFSADWCWKVLPKKLFKELNNYFKESHEYELTIGFNSGECYVTYSRYYSHQDQLCCDTLVHNYAHQALIYSTSLHEALLEMVCWTIDNGFLKGEKCEKSN